MNSLRTQRWLSGFAVLLLLATTAVPAMVRMSCSHNGHVELSFGRAGDCCPPEEPTNGAAIRATCCEVERATPQRTAFNSAATFCIENLLADNAPNAGALDTQLLPQLVPCGYLLNAHPPPLGLIVRLSKVGSFLL